MVHSSSASRRTAPTRCFGGRSARLKPGVRLGRLLFLLASCAALACAQRAPDWPAYQDAGESALVHARYDKSQSLLETALAKAETGPQRVRSLTALARAARERGDVAQARARIDEADALGAALPDDARERVPLALEDAWVALAEGRAADADAAFAHAGALATRLLGDEDRSVGWAWIGRGEARRLRGDRQGAQAAFQAAIAIHRGDPSGEVVRPSEPLGLVAALIPMGALLRENDDLTDARVSLDLAAGIAGRELGTDHPRLADALVEIARVEMARGDREAAARAAQRAAEIASRLPPGHPTRAEVDAVVAASKGM